MNYLCRLFSDRKSKETEDERVIVKVMQEKKNLPMKLKAPMKLSKLIEYYNVYWNKENSDEEK